MNSDLTAVLIGLAITGLALVAIGVLRAIPGRVERIRLSLGERRSRSEGSALVRETRPDSAATTHEAERKAEELLANAEAQDTDLVRAAEAEAQLKATEVMNAAEQRARGRLEEAEIEAKRIAVEAGNEQARLGSELARERSLLEQTRSALGSLAALEGAVANAEELIADAEKRREVLLRHGEAEAERTTEEARRQAKELLAEAELEARRIVDAAQRERAELRSEFAQKLAVLEETRTRLSGLLADVLDEVEGAPVATNDADANGRQLDEALRARASARDGQ